MKKLIQMYAKYNHEINKKIIDILSKLSKDDLLKNRNFYYLSKILRNICLFAVLREQGKLISYSTF